MTQNLCGTRLSQSLWALVTHHPQSQIMSMQISSHCAITALCSYVRSHTVLHFETPGCCAFLCCLQWLKFTFPPHLSKSYQGSCTNSAAYLYLALIDRIISIIRIIIPFVFQISLLSISFFLSLSLYFSVFLSHLPQHFCK